MTTLYVNWNQQTTKYIDDNTRYKWKSKTVKYATIGQIEPDFIY